MALLNIGDRRIHYEISRAVDPGDTVLLFHHGQPGAALVFDELALAADRHGLAVVMVSRPGYAESDRLPGRRVADVTDDVTAVLDDLQAGRFVAAGWSGGGPHALACGALLEQRCSAVASIAGVAPYRGADDLDWTAGMGAENVAEFEALISGDPDLEGRIAELCRALSSITAEELATALGGLISPPDRAALDQGFAEFVAEWFRRSASSGHYGYWDDDQAFVSPWGFDLQRIVVPVHVWIAGQDRMVPPSHGRWLASNIPGAAAYMEEAEGHISLITEHLDDIVARLAAVL